MSALCAAASDDLTAVVERKSREGQTRQPAISPEKRSREERLTTLVQLDLTAGDSGARPRSIIFPLSQRK